MKATTTRAGDLKKKGQKHQNQFKFRANKHSTKSHKLADTPLDRICPRCYDIIKWKIDYHKYKPLREPGKCKKCEGRTVVKAYRQVCDKCSDKFEICAKCCEKMSKEELKDSKITKAEKFDKIQEALLDVREREKRTIIRKIMKHEIDYDPVKGLVYTGKSEEERKKPVDITHKKGKECDSCDSGEGSDNPEDEGLGSDGPMSD